MLRCCSGVNWSAALAYETPRADPLMCWSNDGRACTARAAEGDAVIASSAPSLPGRRRLSRGVRGDLSETGYVEGKT